MDSKRFKRIWNKKSGCFGMAVLSIFFVILVWICPVNAKVAIETASGWEFSTDGFINAFGVYEECDDLPPGTDVSGGLLTRSDEDSARIRTGLLPGLIAFNVKAPTTKGLDIGSRVGFYPQIQNANTRTQFGSQIDLREAFLTVDGNFGQFLAGRALHLYQGKNILTDMTLFGVGVEGPITSGGTTLGYIGYGYVYTNFGAQFQYTTPDFSGFKIAVSVNDPSQIAGDVAATVTDSFGYEAELSYTGKIGNMALQAWLNGLYQEAEFANGGDVTASGWAAGIGLDIVRLHLLLSGFGGQAIGSSLMLDFDSLDPAGEERDSSGFLVQTTYSILSSTKLGVQYGRTTMDETAAEEAIRLGGGTARLDTQQAWTVGIYHDITPFFKIMGEYTRAKNEWFNSAEQECDVYSIGTFFIW